MGGRVPLTIRRQVIKQWLYGHSRDQIAKDNDIGAGTVSAIIKQCSQEKREQYFDEADFEFDLIRELAVMLKREGLAVNSFGSALRLQKKLDQNHLNEDQMDSFFENADLHCFKRGLKSEDFINSINTVCALSAGLKVPVEELPEYISQQNKKADEINEGIERLKTTEMEAFWDHAVSKEKLEEYERKRPELEKLEATQKELAETKNKNDHFEQQLIACDREIHRLNYEHAIPIDQLMLINKRLDKPLERQEFSDMSKELHHHLAKYPDVIAIIRERIHLRYAPSADLTRSN
jgi:hypothetical protein